jgi:hypothetical protein
MAMLVAAGVLPGAAVALGESSMRAIAAAEAAAASAADATLPAESASVAESSAASAPAPAPRSPPVAATVSKNPYGGHSDEELTALAASWDALGQHERRSLLTEMKRRMARKGDHSGVIRIRTERRYGRIIRQPDGRVIHIETQVVHVRPLDEDDIEEPARQGYGVGFERRVARRGEAEIVVQQKADAREPQNPSEIEPNVLLEGLDPLAPTPLMDPLPIYRASDPAP